ncbi:hypothetical protein ACYOEI_05140, partial [Singulisphaera rosea]
LGRELVGAVEAHANTAAYVAEVKSLQRPELTQPVYVAIEPKRPEAPAPVPFAELLPSRRCDDGPRSQGSMFD